MTFHTLAQQPPVSGREMLDNMSHAFRQTDPNLWWKMPAALSLLALALVLVWVLAVLERRRLERENHPQPMRLYLTALAVLHMPWRDRWHLWRLARALKLPQPAAVLISPAYFDEAVVRYCRTRKWNADTLRHRFDSIGGSLHGP